MSRTIDLVRAFVPKRPDVSVRTLKQDQFELIDSNNPDGEMRKLPSKIVNAQYCWRFDVDNETHWLSQQYDSELIAAQNIDDDDQGQIVGTFAKVSVDGNELHYGPTDLYEKIWTRIQTIGVTNAR